jgi:predicted alpha/beta hydrolase family esterase
MAYAHQSNVTQSNAPLIIAMPGEARGGPSRRFHAAQEAGSSVLLELGMWDEPHRNTWVNKLNLAIYRAGPPVTIVTDGLGCLALTWWAEFEGAFAVGDVAGAMLIGPPDLDRPGSDPRLARFGAGARNVLPFPTLVVGTGREPAVLAETYRRLATEWGGSYLDGGAYDHGDDRAGWPFSSGTFHTLYAELEAHRRIGQHAR